MHTTVLQPFSPETASSGVLETIDELIHTSSSIIASDPAEALGLARRALRMARHQRSLDHEVCALVACGAAYARLGRAGEQIAYYGKAEVLQSRMTDESRRAAVLTRLGRMLRLRGELARALEYQMVGLEIRERLGDRAGLATTLERIAAIRCEQGELDEALRLHLRALEIRTEIGNIAPIAHSLHNIGIIYGYLQDLPTSIDYFRRSLAICEENGLEEGRAFAMTGLATSLIESGDPAAAVPLLRRAIELYDAYNLPMDRATAYNALGTAHEAMNETGPALEALRRGLEIARAQKFTLMIPAILLSIGSLHQKTGDIRGAIITFSRGLQLAERMGIRHDTLVLHDRLAAIFELIGDYRNTVEHLKRRDSIRETMFGPKPLRGVASVEIGNAVSLAEREREVLRRRAEEAERESGERSRELTSMVLNLTRREEALRTVMKVVEPMSRSDDDRTRGMARKILESISSALDAHTEFKVFEEQFERTHHELIRRLVTIGPTLTPTELKICVLIRCDLSTKQIAESLFSSPLTIKTHRTNIRRKLPIGSDGNLSSYLMSL